MLDYLAHIAVSPPEGVMALREPYQGAQLLGHAVHRQADFFIQFLPLQLLQISLRKELRVRQNGRKGMPKVM